MAQSAADPGVTIAFAGTDGRVVSVDRQDLASGASDRTGVAAPPRAGLFRRSALGLDQVVDLYVLTEATLLLVIGWLTARIYVGGWLGVDNFLGAYLGPLIFLPILFITLSRNAGLYQIRRLRAFLSAVGPVAGCLVGGFVALVVIGFLARVANDYSRVWFLTWFAVSGTGILILRAAASGFFARWAKSDAARQTMAVYAPGPIDAGLRNAIASASDEWRCIGLYGPDEARSSGAGLPYLGNLETLIAHARARPLDGIVLAGMPADQASMSGLGAVLERLAVLPTDVRLHLSFGADHIPIRGVSHLNRLDLLDVQRRPMAGWGRLVKSAMDFSIAALGMVAALPLLTLIALAIRIESRGPVIFRQRRHGLNNQEIMIWKFRTMRVMEDGEAFVQAVAGDSRITRIGAFLRRTSLDELPQLINVLKGEMSIVGPRPHPVALNASFSVWMRRYDVRHRVKPGITGWAQINGYRGPTEDPELMRKRIEHDLDYIENWSIWLDLKIILATPFVGLVHKNAL